MCSLPDGGPGATDVAGQVVVDSEHTGKLLQRNGLRKRVTIIPLNKVAHNVVEAGGQVPQGPADGPHQGRPGRLGPAPRCLPLCGG